MASSCHGHPCCGRWKPDDPKGTLFKLTQRGSVNEYLHEFELLANRITDLPPSFLLNCFISGLTSELRREGQALRPISLPQAISLAKLQKRSLTTATAIFVNDHHSPTTFHLTQPPTHHSYQPPYPRPPSTFQFLSVLTTWFCCCC